MRAKFALLVFLSATSPAFAADPLAPPPGTALLAKFAARGDQIYTCTLNGNVYEWRFTGPEAELFDADGAKAGKHYAGPTWEAGDGSKVRGRVVASKAAPDGVSVPWLLLAAASHEGEGRMDEVTYVQRVDTKGGGAPKDGCAADRAGQVARSPYEANYLFYRAPK